MQQAARASSTSVSARRQGTQGPRVNASRSSSPIAKLYLEWKRHWATYSKASASDDRALARWEKLKPTVPVEIGVTGYDRHHPNPTFAHNLKHSLMDCGVVETCRGEDEWITAKGWRTLIDYPQAFNLGYLKDGVSCNPEDIDGIPTDQWLKQRLAIAETFQVRVDVANEAWKRVTAARAAMDAACGRASEAAQQICDEDAKTHADLKIQGLVACKEGEDLDGVLPQYAAGLIRSLLRFVDANAD